MAKSDAERARAYRDRKRGRPARTLAPCGTRAAAVRHRAHNEQVCALCKQAEREYQQNRNNDRKATQ